jgi:small subunit ribosomal protein S8
MMTDPIADLLTRIRNALHARKERVEAPYSSFKERVVEVMQAEGFLGEYAVVEVAGHKVLRIWLKYNEVGQPVIRGLKRVSKPGLRVYVGVQNINEGQQRVGGEVVCAVW